MTEEDRYAKDIATFDALRGVIPKFRAKKAFIRITEPVTPAIQREMAPSAPLVGVNRDRAVCTRAASCNTSTSRR